MTSRAYDRYREMIEAGRHMDAAALAEQQYLADNPGNPFWLIRRASALSRGGRFQQALECTRQALTLDPANPYGILEQAEALKGLKRYEEAMTYYETLVDHPRMADWVRSNALRCLEELGQWDRILEHLDQWQLPQGVLLQWRVKALSRQKRLEPAMEACAQWLAAAPDNRQALWSMTELEIQRDGLEAVIGRMARLAKIASRPPIYKEIYASLCKRAGRAEAALAQYETLARAKGDPRILSKQAFALSKAGRASEAVPLLEELLKLKPGDMFLHASYRKNITRLNMQDRALAFYEHLLDLHPEEKSLYGRIKTMKKTLGAP